MNFNIENLKIEEITQNDIEKYLPKRNVYTHKSNYGKSLLLCGSIGYSGAAKLAAISATRMGAGLVYIGVPEEIYPIIASALNEPIVFPLPSIKGHFSCKAISELCDIIDKFDAILFGPGVGNHPDTYEICNYLIQNSKVPLLLDADGINVLSTDIDILKKANCPIILTPHDGEFSRINCNSNNSEIHVLKNRISKAINFAANYNVVLLRKGYNTIITNGQRLFINKTGNPGMAKGGSGDVLSGIIISLLSRKISPIEGAALGAFIHGKSGDICAKKYGEEYMLPTDIINELYNVTNKNNY